MIRKVTGKACGFPGFKRYPCPFFRRARYRQACGGSYPHRKGTGKGEIIGFSHDVPPSRKAINGAAV
jgi:hypothetical protein